MAIDNVNVALAVQDTQVTQAGFGTLMILGLHTAFTDRAKIYTSLTGVGIDFPTTSKIYKAAARAFSQSPAPAQIKVGRIDAGDADLTATLDAIALVDLDWYGLVLESRLTADALLAAAWIEANGKVFYYATEDADVITSATTDVVSVLKGFGYDRTSAFWHHEAGVESLTGNAISVTSGVATVTKTAHGLRVNDPVTVSGAIDFASSATSLVGNFIVASVPTADTFTYAAPLAADGAATGTITYFARYLFPEVGIMGYEFTQDPGSYTAKFKSIAGVTATPTSIMNSAQRAFAEGKNANVYVESAGVSIYREGIMVSGRYQDLQRGLDWLQARMEERIFTELVNLVKIPYTNAGMTTIISAMTEILNQALSQGVINPLSDELNYEIIAPNVFDIPTADRLNRLFPDITFRALVGNAVHGVTITGTLGV